MAPSSAILSAFDPAGFVGRLCLAVPWPVKEWLRSGDTSSISPAVGFSATGRTMCPVEFGSLKLVVRSHFGRGTSIPEHESIRGPPLKRIFDGPRAHTSPGTRATIRWALSQLQDYESPNAAVPCDGSCVVTTRTTSVCAVGIRRGRAAAQLFPCGCLAHPQQ